jgi:cytidylate kinase
MIIAVDGPTASGKGTIAKALAAHFGLPHLDTGLLYRAVGRQVALNGAIPMMRAMRWPPVLSRSAAGRSRTAR